MATKYTQPTWRGICLLDPRWSYANYSNSNSTATQDGAEADQPVLSGGRGSFMQLEARGALSVDNSIIDIKMQKEGIATGNTPGGRFIWKDEEDSATSWKGWLSYNKITHFDWILYEGASGDPGSDPGGYQSPHGISTPSDRAIVVYDDHQNTRVAAMYRDAAAATWTHVAVVSKSVNWFAHPTITRLTGGRLLCFYVLKTLVEGATTYFTIGMSFSDDDGATWTTGGQHLTGPKINAYVTSTKIWRLRVVSHNDILTLVIGYYNGSAPTDQVDHWVSVDLGASFSEITEAVDGAGNNTIGEYRSWDLVALPTGSVLWVGADSSQNLRRWMKTTPYQAFQHDPDGGTTLMGGCDTSLGVGVAACVDHEGFVWILARKHSLQPDPAISGSNCTAIRPCGSVPPPHHQMTSCTRGRRLQQRAQMSLWILAMMTGQPCSSLRSFRGRAGSSASPTTTHNTTAGKA